MWSNLSDPILCTTRALRPSQPHVLPPRSPPSLTSVTVAVRPPPDDEHAALHVEYRLAGVM